MACSIIAPSRTGIATRRDALGFVRRRHRRRNGAGRLLGAASEAGTAVGDGPCRAMGGAGAVTLRGGTAQRAAAAAARVTPVSMRPDRELAAAAPFPDFTLTSERSQRAPGLARGPSLYSRSHARASGRPPVASLDHQVPNHTLQAPGRPAVDALRQPLDSRYSTACDPAALDGLFPLQEED